MKIVSVIVGVILLTSFCFAQEVDIKEEALVHGLSNAIVEGCKTDETKVTALMTFVHDKVKPKEGENPYEQMSTLKRIEKGAGWCNHQAVIFMHLAYYQEIRTRLLYLIADDGVTSPHTIAEWHDGTKWIIVDPLFMMTGITRDEIRKSVLIDDIPFSLFKGQFPVIADRPNEWLKCFINEPKVIFEYDTRPTLTQDNVLK